MTASIMYLDEFLARMQLEGPIKLTWLIGAGMSASAGVPLAVDVSRRVILFNYLAHLKSSDSTFQVPWDNSLDRLSYSKFEDYLDWYENAHNRIQVERMLAEAIADFGTKEKFRGLSPENPQCYPQLFANTFVSDKPHEILTSLVKRMKGVNIAHLALAGLMRDHPDWGKTVFTTNFDDLLLKSFLAINHTARVFGELLSQDRPDLNPTYPQIVHLHGRHTGYRLANTAEQFKLLDPNLERGFLGHLRESYLVVLGYSGWDDMAMSALRNWQHDDTIVKGIYWVPFHSEEYITAETREFLDNCPPHKAFIILNREKTLCADSFMLELCRALNPQTGFASIRKGILDYANNQHQFVLQQLASFPDHDPIIALSDAQNAVALAIRGKADEALALVSDGKAKLGEDTNHRTLAMFELLAGTVCFLVGNYNEAEEKLRQSLSHWSPEPESGVENDGRSRTSLLLGQLYLRKCSFDEAHKAFVDARRHADRNSNSELRSLALLGHAMTTCRYSPSGAHGMIEDAIATAEEAQVESRNRILGECHRVLGEVFRGVAEDKNAQGQYSLAYDFFSKAGNKIGRARVLKSFADVAILEKDFSKAQSYLESAKASFKDEKDTIGLLSVLQSEGDWHYAQDNAEGAIVCYERALECAKEADCGYSEIGTFADILKCQDRVAELKQSSRIAIPDGLLEQAKVSRNVYASQIISEVTPGNVE